MNYLITFEKRHWYLYGFFIFLISSDVVIIWNIPIFQQVLGFLFLFLIPGILVLQILKHEIFNIIEKFVLIIGTSIVFVLIFGILLNNISLLFNYWTPLSQNHILIFLNIAYITMMVIGYQIKNSPLFELNRIYLECSEKAFLVPLILFPALSLIGMYFFNTYENNTIIIILLLSIPIYLISTVVFNRKFSSRLYPIALLSIGSSLMLLYALRSNHILGSDTHTEFLLFISTLTNQYWQIVPGTSLGAALSISILPSIFQILTNIDPEFLFRILYVLLCLILPLVVYIIAEKYVDKYHAFLVAIFFLISSIFLMTTSQSRTSLALLFVALSIMVLLNEKIHGVTKSFLLITFVIGCILSHYTSSYVFFIILFSAYLIQSAISKKQCVNFLNFYLIALFFALMIFWYQQVLSVFLGPGVDFIISRQDILYNFLILDNKIHSVVTYDFKLYHTLLWRLYIWDYELIWMFTQIGILAIILYFIGYFSTKLKKYIPRFSDKTVDVPFIILALICSIFFFFITYASFIFKGYSVDRLNSLILIISSIFLVFGITVIVRCIFVFRNFLEMRSFNLELLQIFIKKENQRNITKIVSVIFLILLIVQYFYSIGLMHQISGDHVSIIYNTPVNNQSNDYGNLYQFDQEIVSANWLKTNVPVTHSNIYSDLYGGTKYRSRTGEITDSHILSLFSTNKKPLQDQYIYLTHTNTKNKILISGTTGQHPIMEYNDVFLQKFLIYDNDISKIYL